MRVVVACAMAYFVFAFAAISADAAVSGGFSQSGNVLTIIFESDENVIEAVLALQGARHTSPAGDPSPPGNVVPLNDYDVLYHPDMSPVPPGTPITVRLNVDGEVTGVSVATNNGSGLSAEQTPLTKGGSTDPGGDDPPGGDDTPGGDAPPANTPDILDWAVELFGSADPQAAGEDTDYLLVVSNAGNAPLPASEVDVRTSTGFSGGFLVSSDSRFADATYGISHLKVPPLGVGESVQAAMAHTWRYLNAGPFGPPSDDARISAHLLSNGQPVNDANLANNRAEHITRYVRQREKADTGGLTVRGRLITGNASRTATRIEVAVVRASDGAKTSAPRCQSMNSRKASFKQVPVTGGRCRHAFWLRAKGTRRWKLRLKRPLPKGRYVVYSRAIAKDGSPEYRFSKRDGNRRKLRVRK